ncbi:uncharacterized protein E0L32_005567 [Thyridium curvatum]|uniref:Mitotic checkpoint regulator, MAD2B-interacting-domain-containing protein n=1 Tax=Thyridium curvatum TaxID=1093900 RepID=A0A507BBG4_9PEZI|nr:uncharacterized protein E0L32_005567 [Thyridium curvatum]TPX14371.1 hypothetical protein E0L32_005567 [Thyridium curvatum]
MGLVDYSDSDSEGESSPPPQSNKPTATTATNTTDSSSKKPFQRLVDSATGSRKIVVNLPQAASASSEPSSDEPPAKRARTVGGGGSRFSGFSSFLPAPKTTGKPAPATQASSSNSRPAPRIGVHLKTSAEAAFSRDREDDSGIHAAGTSDGAEGASRSSGLNLPAPKGPSIPEGQKPAEDVQLVGKPLMFKPLSVSRKPAKKKGVSVKSAGVSAQPTTTTTPAVDKSQAAPEKKKVSLFSLGVEDDASAAAQQTPDNSGAYEPLFHQTSEVEDDGVTGPYDAHQAHEPPPPQAYPHQAHTLDDMADDLNLSAAERRALFGRGGKAAGTASAASKVINFDMDREYRHNEELRASGEQQSLQHNPVRTIQPGKHSLRQLVNQVQTQKDALEDMFAKNRSTQREASGRYGWR